MQRDRDWWKNLSPKGIVRGKRGQVDGRACAEVEGNDSCSEVAQPPVLARRAELAVLSTGDHARTGSAKNPQHVNGLVGEQCRHNNPPLMHVFVS